MQGIGEGFLGHAPLVAEGRADERKVRIAGHKVHDRLAVDPAAREVADVVDQVVFHPEHEVERAVAEVKVDQQHLFAQAGERDGKPRTDRGFSHAALAGGNQYSAHGAHLALLQESGQNPNVNYSTGGGDVSTLFACRKQFFFAVGRFLRTNCTAAEGHRQRIGSECGKKLCKR